MLIIDFFSKSIFLFLQPILFFIPYCLQVNNRKRKDKKWWVLPCISKFQTLVFLPSEMCTRLLISCFAHHGKFSWCYVVWCLQNLNATFARSHEVKFAAATSPAWPANVSAERKITMLFPRITHIISFLQ